MMRRVRDLMDRDGMSQRELAKALGAAPSTVSMWFTGARKPTLHHLVLMCELFGTSLDWIVRGKDGQA